MAQGALAANAVSVLTLSETCDHITVRLFFHQDTAGDESSVLKVNANALLGRAQVLTINPGTARFVPGDVVHDTTGNTNATAVVCYNLDANNILVTNLTGNTTFGTSDRITGNREGSGTANVTAVAAGTPVLEIDSILWSVTGTSNTKVGIEVANSTASYTLFTLSGEGYYGRNELDAPIGPPPPAVLPTPLGHIYVSTYNVPAKGGYSITLSLRKTTGYAQPPIY